jgi:hypothetical protein
VSSVVHFLLMYQICCNFVSSKKNSWTARGVSEIAIPRERGSSAGIVVLIVLAG